ncbi:MAG: helix-turn-helix transcriptional regulator [Kiritimatiellae bacterium]|nr:helix-turn-helix transcriptional regulator [Kiritimatiellia bacterium]
MKRNQVMDRTWLERARREKGFTQEQVAEAAKITTAGYNRIEKGLFTPGIVTGLLICDKLGISPRQFLTERPIGYAK